MFGHFTTLCISVANKYYSSAGHHEQKNKKTTDQIIRCFITGHDETTNKTSLKTFSM